MAYNFLIVDDSSTTRTIIKKILGLSDLKIGNLYEAENGKEALQKMKENWIDLVFADINMPEMTGIEMVNQMKKDGVLDTVPVVIVSSEGSETRIEELKNQGVTDYLRKPFTPELIKGVAEKILGGKDDVK